MIKHQKFPSIIYWMVLLIPLAILALIQMPTPAYAQQATPTATPVKQQPLNWVEPVMPRIQLVASAMAANENIIYTIYPTNPDGQPVWDVKISVPLPEGATFLVAGASPPFAANFDGRKITFSAVEWPDKNQPIALHFQVSVAKLTKPLAPVHASASWKYVKTNLGQSIFAQETTESGDIAVQPQGIEQVVADRVGDTPFANYDLTSVVLQQEQAILKINFNTAGNLGPATEKLEYYLYIDDDCNADTGRSKNGFGSEYRVRFRYSKGLADISQWDETTLLTDTVGLTDTVVATDTEAVSDTGAISGTNAGKVGSWRNIGSLSVSSPATGKLITVWVPHSVLANGTQFCWYAEAQNKSDLFVPKPPTDEVPDGTGDLPSLQYSAVEATAKSLNTFLTDTNSYSRSVSIQIPLAITSTVASVPPLAIGVNGKLAIPLKNSENSYDIHIFSLPDGQEVDKIANASQPSFSFDGQSLLLLRQTAQANSVYEYALASKSEVQLSGVISGVHPFYDARGKALLYAKSASPQNSNKPLVDLASFDSSAVTFVQCDLAGLRQRTAAPCQNMLDFGALAVTGQISDVKGIDPIWAANHLVVYRGCVSAATVDDCGIFTGGALLTNSGASEPFLRQLTGNKADVPTDSKGNLIAFMSRGATDWDVYVMRLDGAWIKNLSNNPAAQDGLPVLSPDGKWVAFVSNRDGKWAVWAVSVVDGQLRKLFDVPAETLWDNGTKTWMDQRITWGP